MGGGSGPGLGLGVDVEHHVDAVLNQGVGLVRVLGDGHNWADVRLIGFCGCFQTGNEKAWETGHSPPPAVHGFSPLEFGWQSPVDKMPPFFGSPR